MTGGPQIAVFVEGQIVRAEGQGDAALLDEIAREGVDAVDAHAPG